MADLGIARVTNEADAANTLTRADLADVVHRRLGLSRAESAGLVERVLHHMCHALSVGQNVKISGFGNLILKNKGQHVGLLYPRGFNDRNQEVFGFLHIAQHPVRDAKEPSAVVLGVVCRGKVVAEHGHHTGDGTVNAL